MGPEGHASFQIFTCRTLEEGRALKFLPELIEKILKIKIVGNCVLF